MKTKAAVGFLCAVFFAHFQPQNAWSQSVRFTQVAEAAGLWDQNIYSRASRDGAQQAVWVDYDRDSDLDLFYTDYLQNFLYGNQGDGNFLSVIRGTGLKDSSNFYSGALWSDINNDGHVDVFFKTAQSFPLLLYQNLGNGLFQDITSSSGLSAEGGVDDATWMDYDRDGQLDLFICNRISQTLIYRNAGSGTFENVTTGSGLEADSAANAGLSWSDYDYDGDLDLFIARDQGFWPAPSSLYRHESDGTFTNVSQEAGIHVTGFASVAVWGDYNRDGFSDLYVARHDAYRNGTETSNLLFRNRGDGAFEEVGAIAGVDDTLDSQTAVWVDFDNDGWLDLSVVNFNFQPPDSEPDRLYKNNGDGTFSDVAPEAGINFGNTGKHAVWGDYDRDGDMDLFLSYFQFHPQSGDVDANLLFRNETQNHWLEINLEPRASHHVAGAKVLVYVAGVILQKEATQGSMLAPEIADRLLIGLGQNTMADSVVVYWNNGRRDATSTVRSNSVLVAKEGRGIGTAVKQTTHRPAVFELFQNYPNPFNPRTAFRYQLPRAVHVKLEIYNLLGARIAVLVDEHKSAGAYLARWNGRDNSRQLSSSGIYFAKFTAYNSQSGESSEVRIKKIVLSK